MVKERKAAAKVDLSKFDKKTKTELAQLRDDTIKEINECKRTDKDRRTQLRAQLRDIQEALIGMGSHEERSE